MLEYNDIPYLTSKRLIPIYLVSKIKPCLSYIVKIGLLRLNNHLVCQFNPLCRKIPTIFGIHESFSRRPAYTTSNCVICSILESTFYMKKSGRVIVPLFQCGIDRYWAKRRQNLLEAIIRKNPDPQCAARFTRDSSSPGAELLTVHSPWNRAFQDRLPDP